MTSKIMPLSTEEKAALCEAKVTINGLRARISGYALSWAKVTVTEGPFKGASAEWSWHTVKHVVENCNGEFKLS